MLMTKELKTVIDEKLLAMSPDAEVFSEDEAWDCFIDTLQECEMRLSQIDESLLFQKYLDWTFLNIQ
jgi:3-deoxy-D-manno-octulosonic-acid transferase